MIRDPRTDFWNAVIILLLLLVEGKKKLFFFINLGRDDEIDI